MPATAIAAIKLRNFFIGFLSLLVSCYSLSRFRVNNLGLDQTAITPRDESGTQMIQKQAEDRSPYGGKPELLSAEANISLRANSLKLARSENRSMYLATRLCQSSSRIITGHLGFRG